MQSLVDRSTTTSSGFNRSEPILYAPKPLRPSSIAGRPTNYHNNFSNSNTRVSLNPFSMADSNEYYLRESCTGAPIASASVSKMAF